MLMACVQIFTYLHTHMKTILEDLQALEDGGKMSLQPWENPDFIGNSRDYHTGRTCITPNCNNRAGAYLTHVWCAPCFAQQTLKYNPSFLIGRRRSQDSGIRSRPRPTPQPKIVSSADTQLVASE